METKLGSIGSEAGPDCIIIEIIYHTHLVVETLSFFG
jgi:hypothetical protein